MRYNRRLRKLYNRTDKKGEEEDDGKPTEEIQIDYGSTVDENGSWSLSVKESVVNAVGPDYQNPNLYTTGSPACLRPWFGEYELSIDEVVENYIKKSDTGVTKSGLCDKVRETVEDREPYKDEETLRELYSNEMSQEQIAYELGCSVRDVRKWMDRHGIHVGENSEHYSRHGKQVGETKTDSDNDHDENRFPDDETVLRLHNDGLSLQEIADEVGQPPHVVYCLLDSYDI